MAYDDGFKSKSAAPAAAAAKPHKITMEDRKRLSLTGVEEVGSFDEHEIAMRTSGGGLIIAGEDLSIGRLDVEAGNVEVRGRISELRYEEAEPSAGRSLWSRMFH